VRHRRCRPHRARFSADAKTNLPPLTASVQIRLRIALLSRYQPHTLEQLLVGFSFPRPDTILPGHVWYIWESPVTATPGYRRLGNILFALVGEEGIGVWPESWERQHGRNLCTGDGSDGSLQVSCVRRADIPIRFARLSLSPPMERAPSFRCAGVIRSPRCLLRKASGASALCSANEATDLQKGLLVSLFFFQKREKKGYRGLGLPLVTQNMSTGEESAWDCH
jgi:hypothetical protein